ncbi:MAG: hypothetical protein PHN75_10670 [Syntrophales bacterium]|nr:hypothetical protein [Syntrophales bacterium]
MRVLKMKYGNNGEKVDAFGIRFYGDIDSKLGPIGSVNEMLTDPDLPPVIKNKRITLWFTLEKIHPYKKLSHLLDELKNLLMGNGYVIIISSMDELVDTTSPQFAGRPESKFPVSDKMHGYNAASGFSVTAEKNEATSEYSLEEIERIQKSAVHIGLIVYGRSLKRLI